MLLCKLSRSVTAQTFAKGLRGRVTFVLLIRPFTFSLILVYFTNLYLICLGCFLSQICAVPSQPQLTFLSSGFHYQANFYYGMCWYCKETFWGFCLFSLYISYCLTKVTKTLKTTCLLLSSGICQFLQFIPLRSHSVSEHVSFLNILLFTLITIMQRAIFFCQMSLTEMISSAFRSCSRRTDLHV